MFVVVLCVELMISARPLEVVVRTSTKKEVQTKNSLSALTPRGLGPQKAPSVGHVSYEDCVCEGDCDTAGGMSKTHIRRLKRTRFVLANSIPQPSRFLTSEGVQLCLNPS